MLGQWEEAASSLGAAQKIDYDDDTHEMMNTIGTFPNLVPAIHSAFYVLTSTPIIHYNVWHLRRVCMYLRGKLKENETMFGPDSF